VVVEIRVVVADAGAAENGVGSATPGIGDLAYTVVAP
jgi:hypothetical protein